MRNLYPFTRLSSVQFYSDLQKLFAFLPLVLATLFVSSVFLSMDTLAQNTQSGDWIGTNKSATPPAAGGGITTAGTGDGEVGITLVTTHTGSGEFETDQEVMGSGSSPFSPDGYSQSGIKGASSLSARIRWSDDDGSFTGDGVSILTFTFDRPVTNPVLHIDKLGGSSRPNTYVNYLANSALITLTDINGSSAPSQSLTRLSGVGHFVVNELDNEIHRQTRDGNNNPIDLGSTSIVWESTIEYNVGTSCGSVRINGKGITSVIIRIELFEDPGTSSTNDLMEFLWSFNQDLGDAPISGTSFGAAIHNINEGFSNLPPQNPSSQPSRPTFSSLVHMGPAGPDDDVDSQPNTTADGDDNNGVDDEDGVILPTLYAGHTGPHTVSVVCEDNDGTEYGATVYGWIDFDRSGTFDADEFSSAPCIDTNPSGTGTATLTFSGAGATVSSTVGDIYSRFRITTASLGAGDFETQEFSPGSWDGIANDGEVEDYMINISYLCSTVQLKALLEGPWISAKTMNTDLNDNHLLPGQDKDLSPNFSVQIKATHTPFGQPYSIAPWTYSENSGMKFGDASSPLASGTIVPYDNDVVDWVLVTVREDGILPVDNVWQCAGWLKSNGDVTFPEECACLVLKPSEDYYIMVEHRNHLGVLSPSSANKLSGMAILEWDFTTQNSYRPFVFREGQKEIATGIWAMYAGNGNQDPGVETINSADQTVWKNDQNEINYLFGDFNMNVIANSQDETIWKNNQNFTSGVTFN